MFWQLLHYAWLSAISPRLSARANLKSASSCCFLDIVDDEELNDNDVSPIDAEALVEDVVVLLSENAHANSPSLIPLEFCKKKYRNNSVWLERQVWANSVDPDQTRPVAEVDQGLHRVPFCQHLWDAKVYC